MQKIIIPIVLAILLTSCGQEYGKVSYSEAPKIINVSHYDPKERQKSGSSYSPLNQAALRANGAQALIARIAKGSTLDSKCADFLVGAERQGMLLGTYYFLLPNSNPTYQAQRYISLLRQVKASRGLRTPKVLLVADVHTKCKPYEITAFVLEVHRLTGVRPVIYLENSDTIRRNLQNATPSQKSILRKSPYWLALYSNTYSGLETPQKLTDASGIWSTWAMWQYGGVWWKNGASRIHNYRGGSWQTPKYFGNLDRPTERSGFNGSQSEFRAFWDKHSWAW